MVNLTIVIDNSKYIENFFLKVINNPLGTIIYPIYVAEYTRSHSTKNVTGWLYAMAVLKTLCQVPGQEPDTNKP